MSTKCYLVRLVPHDKFFFGGENTFGGKDGSATNYLVKSNYYPQQTGILGLVRYQLLVQNGCMNQENRIADKQKAQELIGVKSFATGDAFNFGNIKSISPLFFSVEGDYLFPCAKEYQSAKGSSVYSLRHLNFDKPKTPLLENYDPKEGLPDLLVDQSLKTFHDLSNVFTPLEQKGIKKNYEGLTDDKSYYLQTYYRFKENGSFNFIVELDEDTVFESQPTVIFGGEQSAFRMEVQKDNVPDYNDIKPQFEANKFHDKLVLLSDAYLSNEDWLKLRSDLAFCICDTVSFRFLKSNVENTDNYAKIGGHLTKSGQYNLIKRGAVFFGKRPNMEQYFASDLFYKTGYNYYTTTEAKS